MLHNRKWKLLEYGGTIVIGFSSGAILGYMFTEHIFNVMYQLFAELSIEIRLILMFIVGLSSYSYVGNIFTRRLIDRWIFYVLTRQLRETEKKQLDNSDVRGEEVLRLVSPDTIYKLLDHKEKQLTQTLNEDEYV